MHEAETLSQCVISTREKTQPAGRDSLKCGGCGVRPTGIGLRIASVIIAAIATFFWMTLTCCGRGCFTLLAGQVRRLRVSAARMLVIAPTRARWSGETGDARIEL